MKKRVITILLGLTVALSVSVPALAANTAQAAQKAAGSLSNFKIQNIFSGGQFRDVADYAWYAMYVQAGYEFGIVGGKAPTRFAPADKMTIAEAVKTAAILSSIYYTGKAQFTAGSTWYQPYANYALKHGILQVPPADYTAYITRAEYVEMIMKTLPAEAFPAMNAVADNMVPDVSLSDNYGAAVYKLYKAGILTGCDSYGTFYPDYYLSRAEATAMIARITDTAFRKSFVIPQELNAEEIYEKCAPAVFYLERYDSEGTLLGIGSGFFITRDGLALTNYHVINGASSAIVTTADGRSYPVKGICGYDKATDLAILQIDGSGFSYLSIGDSKTLTVGAEVYAIGSPYGMVNSLSNGVVSSLARDMDGMDYIQYTAPISMGSGGGPVLNTSGQVVGVTCLTVLSGQALNFAVPINKMAPLSRTGSVPLISIIAANTSSIICYTDHFPVPDYGVFTGTPIYKTQFDAATNVKTYYYKQSDITVGNDKSVTGYIDLLKQLGFEWKNSYKNAGGGTVDVYYNGHNDISVHFGTDILDGIACRVVAIS